MRDYETLEFVEGSTDYKSFERMVLIKTLNNDIVHKLVVHQLKHIIDNLFNL